MTNWRAHRVLAFVVIIATAMGLLGVGFNLEDKAFNFISWKTILLFGQAYLAWVFWRLLNV